MGDVLFLIAKRALSAVVVLFVVVTFVFFFMRLAGDPVSGLVGADASSEDVIAAERRLGLDKPILEQYGTYLANVVRGDFGQSFRFGVPALELVLERLPATLKLASISLLLTVGVAVPVGIIAALKPGSLADNVSRLVAVIGQTVPVFWLGILLIIVFAVKLSWLPAGGSGSWKNLVLPAITLSAYSIPLTMRLTRSSMLEVLGQDYIRAARARGLTTTRVLVNHGLRNASVPIITVIGLRAGHVLSGAVVLEQVFSYPGMGRLATQSMLLSDYNVIQAFVFITGIIVISASLIVDVIHGIIDPRVRLA